MCEGRDGLRWGGVEWEGLGDQGETPGTMAN